MFDSLTVIAIVCGYMGMLFLGAMALLRFSRKGRNIVGHPVVYALSLGVYCTSWTYYGSVGVAVSSGVLFLAIYLGTTLSAILWWKVLRKLVRLKNVHRITSIADFVSSRYNKSQGVAALATIVAFVGSLPYVALQLRSIKETFAIISADAGTSRAGGNLAYMVVILMILFTITFGVRRLDPTERHPGIVLLVAAQSLVKLGAFLAAGIFVTFFLFNGFGDIFDKFAQYGSPFLGHMQSIEHSAYIKWTSYLVLAMSAVLFLPRQFHMAVIENTNEKKILTAMWVFPLYLLLINIFVLPIALAGLISGLPIGQADTYVLALPMLSQKPWLVLLVFIGGFSAATSMIMVTSMTMATMLTNHLLLPAIRWFQGLGWLRRHLLKCRWAAVALFILLGYFFESRIGQSYLLVTIGVISFSAALQLAPAILGGLFWRKGNKLGCLMGLSGGFLVWLYTMLLPALAKSGWISESFLVDGLFGLAFLKPQQLFGLTVLEPVSHCLFWSMLVNIGLYIAGSVYFSQSVDEKNQVSRFFSPAEGIANLERGVVHNPTIELAKKIEKAVELFTHFSSRDEAVAIVQRCLRKAKIKGRDKICIYELSEFYSRMEKCLAGFIGSAAAHVAMLEADFFTPAETKELSAIYSAILAQLRVTPEDLRRRIDYYREREEFFSRNARELEVSIQEREIEIRERKKAEAALEAEKESLSVTLRSITNAVITVDTRGRIVLFNRVAEELTGWDRLEALGQDLDTVYHAAYAEKGAECVNTVESVLQTQRTVESTGTKILVSPSGKERYVEECGAPLKDKENNMLGVVLVVRDITERLKFEKESLKTAKLESLGVLAGGIAHDFNNLLMAILGNISLAKLDLKADKKALERLDDAESATLRAGRLANQLLTFSSGGAPIMEVTPLGGLITDSVRYALKGTHVRCEFQMPAEIWTAEVDSAQISQVIDNLILNAYQALPEGGLITVRAQNVVVNTEDRVSLPPGNYVKTTIADQGMGIPDDILDKIFDPYFTTKHMGAQRGLGLGLATVYSIIKNHKGLIEVASQVGKGTQFHFYLPASGTGQAETIAGNPPVSKGQGKVLLMDDDDLIRKLCANHIEHLGYKASLARDGDEAIAIYKAAMDSGEPFEVVIMDLTIPGGMGGIEAIKHLQAIDPGVRAIISSGYFNDPVIAEYEKYGFIDALKKPYRLEDLSRVLENAAERRSILGSPFGPCQRDSKECLQ